MKTLQSYYDLMYLVQGASFGKYYEDFKKNYISV